MGMVIQIIGAFIASLASGIVIDTPNKYLPHTAAIGAAGWAIYLLVLPGSDPASASYFGGLTIALGAHILARLAKTPVTVLLIPALFPLVPGVGMYNTVLAYLHGESTMFSQNLKLTLLIAGMLALAVYTADALVSLFYRFRKLYNKLRA